MYNPRERLDPLEVLAHTAETVLENLEEVPCKFKNQDPDGWRCIDSWSKNYDHKQHSWCTSCQAIKHMRLVVKALSELVKE